MLQTLHPTQTQTHRQEGQDVLEYSQNITPD